MTAIGRKRPFDSAYFRVSERPLSGKADVPPGALENRFANDRFTPETGHWGDKVLNDR